ncbi:MAG: hypothetical protein H8E03_00760 [Pelagibacteraceae bacterium]|nr:hypothetical protein [Pelagibacteraceae bacterium]
MANTFKNAGVAIGTSATDVYTTPTNTTAVIHAVYITNIHGSNDATANIYVTDDSAASDFYIAKNLTIPNGSTVVLDKPLNMEAADKLRATADSASTLEAFCSILEIT